MTPEQLDEARANEAVREMEERNTRFSFLEAATISARLARENWTPPEPEPVVDSDILAFRDWAAKEWPIASEAASGGHMDTTRYAQAYLAGARMAREQERERAKVLVRGLEDIVDTDQDEISHMAREVLAKYRGES